MKTSNIKDTLSTICGILILLGGALATINAAALHLPVWVTAAGGAMVAIGTAIIGILTGKNPDGSTKTPIQVNELNQTAAATQPKP
jgi:hypothetical protein